jgi:hypothetical protein
MHLVSKSQAWIKKMQEKGMGVKSSFSRGVGYKNSLG